MPDDVTLDWRYIKNAVFVMASDGAAKNGDNNTFVSTTHDAE